MPSPWSGAGGTHMPAPPTCSPPSGSPPPPPSLGSCRSSCPYHFRICWTMQAQQARVTQDGEHMHSYRMARLFASGNRSTQGTHSACRTHAHTHTPAHVHNAVRHWWEGPTWSVVGRALLHNLVGSMCSTALGLARLQAKHAHDTHTTTITIHPGARCLTCTHITTPRPSTTPFAHKV